MSGAPVLDAHAVMAYLGREEGFERVKAHLHRAAVQDRPLRISAVNWGEVRYKVAAKGGDAAETLARLDTLARLARLPIEVVEADRVAAEAAADLKARYGLPYADCFAAALAAASKTAVLTGDPHFKAVEEAVKVEWLR